jgi:hypothetical protein
MSIVFKVKNPLKKPKLKIYYFFNDKINLIWYNRVMVRERYVILYMKECGNTYKDIAKEFNIHKKTAFDIYQSFLGPMSERKSKCIPYYDHVYREWITDLEPEEECEIYD